MRRLCRRNSTSLCRNKHNPLLPVSLLTTYQLQALTPSWKQQYRLYRVATWLPSDDQHLLTKLLYHEHFRPPSSREQDPVDPMRWYSAQMELRWLTEWVCKEIPVAYKDNAAEGEKEGKGGEQEMHKNKKKVAPSIDSLQESKNNHERGRLLKFAVLQRVDEHKPLSYIIGSQPFCGTDIYCAPPILIPRTETEEMVYWLLKTKLEAAELHEMFFPTNNPRNGADDGELGVMVDDLSKMDKTQKRIRILDMCCGTGCIGVSLASRLPYLEAVCVDIDPNALKCTEENIKRNNLQERVQAIRSNMFQFAVLKRKQQAASNMNNGKEDDDDDELKISPLWENSCDILISNPPYILDKQYDSLPPSVKQWESKVALTGDGQHTQADMDYYRELCDFGYVLLKRDKKEGINGRVEKIISQMAEREKAAAEKGGKFLAIKAMGGAAKSTFSSIVEGTVDVAASGFGVALTGARRPPGQRQRSNLKNEDHNNTSLIPNIVLEVGLQAENVASYFDMQKDMWENVELHTDHAQIPRWVTATVKRR